MAENDTKSSSDKSRSSDGGKSDRASEARDGLSDKSRDALSGKEAAVKERDTPATPEERAAGQERMAATGQPAKDRVNQEIARGHGPSAKDTRELRKDGPAAPAQDTSTQAQQVAAVAPDRFDAALDAAVAAAEVPAGNTPGADFILGEPLSTGQQAEILDESATTVATNAARMAEINAEIEIRVTAARETRDPAFMDTPTRRSTIPDISGAVTTRFNETRARETIGAEYATERAQLEVETQAALNMAALADPVDGLNAMRTAAGAALGAADVPDAARMAVLDTGVLSDTGYHRASAFRRAADAWSAGSADMASHPLDPTATTEAYAAANPANPYVAANLDDILGRLSTSPALAADMRLYAATQLGDAIYNAETQNHGALISQIEGGQATSAEALALQAEIGATQQGRAALRQFQTLFSPADLANQYSRTGEMQNRGVLNFRPGTTEAPMGGYPEAIRDTIGPGINAAMDARGITGIAVAATLVIPGPEDLAMVAGARALGGLYRGARLGDEVLEAATDALAPIRRYADQAATTPRADAPQIPDAPVARADGLQPGTEAHKLNRWEHYASNRTEPMSYQRWSALYDRNVTATADAVRRATDYVAETGFGAPNSRGYNVTVNGQQVTRYPDVIDQGLRESRELKSGYQYLSPDIQRQIDADIALRDQRGIASAWVFDIRDGARAPSQPLLDALDTTKIPYQILRP